MADFHCASCGYMREVPDSLAGRKAKCPKCGSTGLVSASAPDSVAPDSDAPKAEAPRAEAPKADTPDTARFVCPSCAHERDVPGHLAGKKAKCPKCGATGLIRPLPGADESPESPKKKPPKSKPAAKPHEPAPPVDGDIDLGDLAERGERLSEAWAETEEREGTDEDSDDLVLPEHIESVRESSRMRPISLTEGNPLVNAVAGFAGGCVAVLFSLAFAAFIFSPGEVARYFPHALGMVLTTAAVVGLVTAMGSWVPFAAAGPESTVAVVLFLLVSSITAQMSGSPPLEIYITCLAGISLSAIATGIGLLIIGRLKAGAWVRFIPYQVVGGIMAAIGYFVLKGVWDGFPGIDACTRELFQAAVNMDASAIMQSLKSEGCRTFLPALVFGLILVPFHSRGKSSLTILILALVAGAATHGFLYWQHIPLDQAVAENILYAPYPTNAFWNFYEPAALSLIHWNVLLDQSGYMAAMIGLITASHMYKVTKIEIATGNDINLDHEISVLGTGNLISGLALGMPGNLSMGRSMGLRALGASGPLAGMTAALVCLACVFFYGEGLGYVPRFIPQGMLILYGLSLLARWLITAKRQFTHPRDYVLLFVVFIFTVTLGFLPGLSIGLALALMLMISQYGKVRVVKHMLSGASYRSNVDRAPSQYAVLRSKGGQICALKLQGFIFLGTINRLISVILNRIDDPDMPPLRYVLLDFTYVSGLDSTVTMSFTRLKQLSVEHGMTLIFSSLSFDLERQLEEGGFAVNEPDNSSLSFVDLDHAMEWCENRILEEAGALSTRRMSLPELLESVFPRPKLLPRLMDYLEEIHVEKDEYVFTQGDPSDAMYFLRSGMITIELEIDGYKKLRLKKLGPGTVFGEMGIYTSDPRSASALASVESVLYRLSTARLQTMQEADPKLVSAVHHFVVNLLAGRVAESNDKVRDLLQ